MSLEFAEKRKEGEIKGGFAEGKADELRKKLEKYKKTGIGYPFDFHVVETLHEYQHEPAIENLIREKQNALKIIFEGMEQERERQEEMKEIYRPWGKSEQDVYNMLKELTGDNKKP